MRRPVISLVRLRPRGTASGDLSPTFIGTHQLLGDLLRTAGIRRGPPLRLAFGTALPCLDRPRPGFVMDLDVTPGKSTLFTVPPPGHPSHTGHRIEHTFDPVKEAIATSGRSWASARERGHRLRRPAGSRHRRTASQTAAARWFLQCRDRLRVVAVRVGTAEGLLAGIAADQEPLCPDVLTVSCPSPSPGGRHPEPATERRLRVARVGHVPSVGLVPRVPVHLLRVREVRDRTVAGGVLLASHLCQAAAVAFWSAGTAVFWASVLFSAAAAAPVRPRVSRPQDGAVAMPSVSGTWFGTALKGV